MSEIDPELRDKIIETHTLIKRFDSEQKEYKSSMNARMKEAKISLEKHQEDVKETFEKHDARIGKGENFRIRVLTYASIAAVAGSMVLNVGLSLGKKALGIGM